MVFFNKCSQACCKSMHSVHLHLQQQASLGEVDDPWPMLTTNEVLTTAISSSIMIPEKTLRSRDCSAEPAKLGMIAMVQAVIGGMIPPGELSSFKLCVCVCLVFELLLDEFCSLFSETQIATRVHRCQTRNPSNGRGLPIHPTKHGVSSLLF